MRVNKTPILNQADSISKQFITDWLSARKPILKNNIKTYDSVYPSGANEGYSDDRINGMLGYQFSNMNKASIEPYNQIKETTHGEYNKKTNSIYINSNILLNKNNKLLDTSITHERTHSLKPIPQEVSVNELLKKHSIYPRDEVQKYQNNSGEIYARLMSVRKQLGLTPDKIITEEDLKQWRPYLQDAELNQYPKKFLLDLFNTVASNDSQPSINNDVTDPLKFFYQNMMGNLYKRQIS